MTLTSTLCRSAALLLALAAGPAWSADPAATEPKVDALRARVLALRSEASKLRGANASIADLKAALAKLLEAERITRDPVTRAIAGRKRSSLEFLESYIANIEMDALLVRLRLGDKDAALAAMEAMGEKMLLPAIAQAIDRQPEAAALRTDPRYVNLMARLKMPATMGAQSVIGSAYKEKLTLEERIAGLSYFWAEARRSFVYFDHVPDLDWDAAYMAFLPRVMQAETTREYYAVMMELAPLLRDGHTSVEAPAELADVFYARPPLTTELIAGRVLVIAVNNLQLRERIKVGDEIVAIDGVPVHEYAKREVAPRASSSTAQDRALRTYGYQLLAGDKSRPLRLGLLDAAGKSRDETVSRALPRDVSSSTQFEFRILPGNIAYLSLDEFEDDRAPKAFVAALPQIMQAKGLILDVRKNGGGSGDMGFDILSYLSRLPVPTAYSTERHESNVQRAHLDYMQVQPIFEGGQPYVRKRDTIFDGPVAVLTGARTFSAAEDFLVAYDSLKRGIMVGQASGGSTGQPLYIKLPGGGRARICVKRDTYPDGREFVGKGIQPDIELALSVEDVRLGRDPVLERARTALLSPK